MAEALRRAAAGLCRGARNRRYGVAAVALGQLPPHAIMQHLEAVMTVANQARARGQRASARASRQFAQAGAKKRRVHLALIYDEVARKSWAERTIAGDPEFKLNQAVGRIDRSLLGVAEGIYDSGEADKGPSGKAEVTGKASGAAAPNHKGAGKGGWKSTPKGGHSDSQGAGKRHHWERSSASQGWHGGTHGWGPKKDERMVTSPKRRKY